MYYHKRCGYRNNVSRESITEVSVVFAIYRLYIYVYIYIYIYIYILVFTTEEFLEIATESWPE